MATIAIIGLGLMGGSLAAACRKEFPSSKIIGVSRNKAALSFALKKKWIHEGSSDLEKVASRADFIVLCTPVDTFKTLLKRLERSVQSGTVVTDVGSLKGAVSNWAVKQHFKKIAFAGAHPMAGLHTRGIEHASASLYKGSVTFVMAGSPAQKKVSAFWKKISGRVAVMSPEKHDEIVAEISHLPHAVATSLVMAASTKNFAFSAGGFIDTTRIAQGDASIWVPIFLENQKAVLKTLKKFEVEFKKLKTAIKNHDENKLRDILRFAAQKRSQISF